jgi:hypothetical protein
VEIVAQALDAGDTPNDAVDRPLVGGALHESGQIHHAYGTFTPRAPGASWSVLMNEAAMSLW